MSDIKQKLNAVNRGWVINIYDGDRRLLCTFDPSHGWVFVTGIVLGGMLMLGWTESDRRRSNPISTVVPQTAPLSID